MTVTSILSGYPHKKTIIGLEPAVIRPTAIGIIIPRVTRIGDSIAISSLGMPYSTSFREVAASVTANAEVEEESANVKGGSTRFESASYIEFTSHTTRRIGHIFRTSPRRQRNHTRHTTRCSFTVAVLLHSQHDIFYSNCCAKSYRYV